MIRKQKAAKVSKMSESSDEPQIIKSVISNTGLLTVGFSKDIKIDQKLRKALLGLKSASQDLDSREL